MEEKSDQIKNRWLVFIGSFIGGTLRYGCTLILPGDRYDIMPLLLINVVGVFVLALTSDYLSPERHLLIQTGLLGGFTSYGALMVEVLNNLSTVGGLLNLMFSFGLSLFAVKLGFYLQRRYLGGSSR